MGKGIVKLGEGNWAVKDGNLLAAKETNGRFKNAEFTVARGTRATYVGRDGLIKESNLQDTNLVTNSDFSNGTSDWEVEGSASRVVGTYQGINNVLKVNILNTATASRIRQPFTYVNGTTYKIVVNVYLESGSFRVDCSDSFVSGDFVQTTDTGSWQTLTAYFTAISSGSNYIWLRSSNAVSEFYIDNVSIQEIKTDTPRIDFTDNTDGHLLLEPESRNLVTYSEDFNPYEIASSTATPNLTTAPDGANTGTLVTAGTNAIALRLSNVVETGKTYTFSCYVKSSGSNITTVYLDIADEAPQAAFTLTNDWQRISTTATVTKTPQSTYHFVDVSTNGSQGDTFYIWGAQVEELSYPTSYIPTNGSQVTRDAETCTGAGEAADFNSEEGVLFGEGNFIESNIASGYNYFASISDSTTSNRLEIRQTNADLQFLWRVSGVYQNNIKTSGIDVGNNFKFALSYSSASMKLFVNGSLIGTINSPSIYTANTLNELAFDDGGGGNNFKGKCKAIRVYKEALSDTELQNLTS